jgi:hypothetical protein
MEPLTAGAIGTVLVKALKKTGEWLWGYAKKALWSLWDNKWIIFIAGTCNGFFIYFYNMLHGWFAFPPILNIAILGIFALINLSWLIGYWKSPPNDSGGSNQGPSVSTGN